MKAKSTFLAYENIGKSVIRVYPEAYESYRNGVCKYYVGIKDVSILSGYMANMPTHFVVHTIDSHSDKMRAVDSKLINPLTLRYMTGSSSGTALNVFYNINDIGIGSDGGGSVLAPATSLNLFGFISPLLPIKKSTKLSTDLIEFSPVAGLISKNIELVKEFYQMYHEINNVNDFIKVKNCDEDFELIKNFGRADMVNYIVKKLNDYDCLTITEGPVDYEGYGDSIHGTYQNEKEQIKGNKYLLKAVAMSGASAIVVPTNKIATSTLIITSSKVEDVSKLFEVANAYIVNENELIKRYYDNIVIDRI